MLNSFLDKFISAFFFSLQEKKNPGEKEKKPAFAEVIFFA